MNSIQTSFYSRAPTVTQIVHHFRKLVTSFPSASIALAVLTLVGLVFVAYKKWCTFIKRGDKIEKKELPLEHPTLQVDATAHKTLQSQTSTSTAKNEVNQVTENEQTTPSTEDTIDPITQMPLGPEDKLVVINNVRFSAETLAYYLVTNSNDHSLVNPDKSEIQIWKTHTEYLAVLQQLLPLIQNPVSIQEIQMRLDGYPLAKALIDEFNQAHPNFSFSHLLECIYQRMKQSSTQGANNMTDEQEEGFEAYYQLRSSLPEKIVKIIFPFYAYDPGDSQCIRSASGVLKKQIGRLTLLGLIQPPSLSSKEEAFNQEIKPYIRWFTEKFTSPAAVQTCEQTHWAGTLTSEKAEQGVINVTIHITLRHVTLTQGADYLDGFASALMEKFQKNKTPFLSIQHPISVLLQQEMPESEKKQAIKTQLQQLINAQHNPLQRLKEICKLDREIFRSMRENLQAQLPRDPKDDVVWARIEQNSALISSTLKENEPLCLHLLIKQALGIEISFSTCWKSKYSSSLVFSGMGDFPQVMHDLRDKSFKLLLSAE